MRGFGKTSVLEAVKLDRKETCCQHFDAVVDNAGCYLYLTVQPTLVSVLVDDGHIVTNWSFRTRNRREIRIRDVSAIPL